MEIVVAPSNNNMAGSYYRPWTVSLKGDFGLATIGEYAHKSNAVRAVQSLPGHLVGGSVGFRRGKGFMAIIDTPESVIEVGPYVRKSNATRGATRFIDNVGSLSEFTVLNEPVA